MAIVRCVELYYPWFHAMLHRLPKIAFSILDTQFMLTQPQLQSGNHKFCYCGNFAPQDLQIAPTVP